MLAVAARHGRLEMTCRLCSTSPELRKRWGCDAPTEQPLFMLECVRCGGPGQDPHCDLCKGTGHEPVHRCPWKLMSRDVGPMIEMYDCVTAGLGLPGSGGVQDQSQVFLECLRLLRAEEARYREEMEKAKSRSARWR